MFVDVGRRSGKELACYLSREGSPWKSARSPSRSIRGTAYEFYETILDRSHGLSIIVRRRLKGSGAQELAARDGGKLEARRTIGSDRRLLDAGRRLPSLVYREHTTHQGRRMEPLWKPVDLEDDIFRMLLRVIGLEQPSHGLPVDTKDGRAIVPNRGAQARALNCEVASDSAERRVAIIILDFTRTNTSVGSDRDTDMFSARNAGDLMIGGHVVRAEPTDEVLWGRGAQLSSESGKYEHG